MSAISYAHERCRIGYEDNPRLFRVYKSPATPAVALVPESQAERILSNETDLLKPEDVFAALLSLPEQRILKSVVLLDERDEFARNETHPKWPPARKSYGGGGEVCLHGVSKKDDPVAILNYHWATQHIILSSLRCLNHLATVIELNLSWLSSKALDVECAAHMAGDILVKQSDAFAAFAARAPLRTLALCRSLGANADVQGLPPLAEWLARRVEYAEAAVRDAARRHLVEIANTAADQWRRDDAISLLLHYGEEEDFRSLMGVTLLRVARPIFAPRNFALLTHLTSLEEVDLSFHKNDVEAWLRALSRCPNVTTLKLRGSGVMSSGLFTLHYFHSLTDLDLAETPIIDVAVPCLIAQQGLKRLDIRGTEISEEGIAQLRRELPSCEIITGW